MRLKIEEMKGMIKIGVLLVSLIYVCDLEAQDPRYSQFYYAPQLTNPAFTGIFNGQARAIINYRDQWASVLGSNPFRTINASADYRYNVAGADYIAGGINILTDQGGSSHYSTQQVTAGVGFNKQIANSPFNRGENHYLSAGFQVGLGRRSINTDDLWFSSQFDINTLSVDNTLPSGEVIAENSGFHLDLNAGIAWYTSFSEKSSIYAGAAMFHLTSPDISLLENGSEKLDRKYTITVGGERFLTYEFSLLPSLLFIKQGQSTEIIAGTHLRYSNRDWEEVALRFGMWPRMNNNLDGIHLESIVFSSAFEMKDWTLGLSYDINTSSLSNVSRNRGAFELSLGYVFEEERIVRTFCPNF
jgi:type IX secretion system PorP/SprF family membrane protein